MHLRLLVVLFACLAFSDAIPTPQLNQAVEAIQTANEQVIGSYGVAKVMFLLFIDIIVRPIFLSILRAMQWPYRTTTTLMYLPRTIIHTVLSLPEMISQLPRNIILLPLTITLQIVRFMKMVLSPITRITSFLINIVAFVFGVPVKAFGRLYFY